MIVRLLNVLLAVNLAVLVESSTVCLDCIGVPAPVDCTTVRHCGPHEVCYVHRYVNGDGILLYDLGCRDQLLCSTPQPFGKRQVRSTVSICEDCCNDKNLCNMGGHCAKDFNPPLGSKLCYQCPISVHPDECNYITYCDQDSACAIYETRNLIGETRWKHKCISQQQCSGLLTSHSDMCHSCCYSDVCNRNCTHTEPRTTPPTTTTTPPTTTTTTTTTKTTTTTSSAILTEGRRCLECSRLTQPLDCSTVTKCALHEVCYVDKYMTNDGITMYDVGCRDPQMCAAPQISPGKRSEIRREASFICSECCNDKDICNIENHCESEKFHPPPGSKLCFSCPYSNRIDDCNQITLCDQDSSCLIKQTTNLVGDSRWTHGCTQKKHCSQIISSQPSGLCASCCDNHLCNMNCNALSTTTVPHTMTTKTPVPLSPPVITGIGINPPLIGYGDNVRVECTATGNEKPTIEFLFRSPSLPGNVHINPTGSHSGTLTITNFVSRNNGMYRCIATNSQGSVSIDFWLTGH